MKKNIYILSAILLCLLQGLTAQDISLTNANLVRPASGQQYGQACFTIIAEDGVEVTSVPLAVEISLSKVQFDASGITGFMSDHFDWVVDGFSPNVIRGTLTNGIPDVENDGGGAQVCVPVRRSKNKDYRDSRNGYVVNIIPGSIDQGSNMGADFTSRFGFSRSYEAAPEKGVMAKNNVTSESIMVDELSIYPNPAAKAVNISATISADEHTISIYDVTGRAMIQSQTFGGSAQIDVVDWASGMYLMEIQNEVTGDKTTQRVMVSK